ncbi:MAG: sagC [Chthonomonadales bacterium]|nr:sagC [Chthonomonadales bacterium]
MTLSGAAPRIYALTEGARVFRNGDEIRFRKGVWSYTEATIRLTGQEEPVKQFFETIYTRFLQYQEVDVDEIGREIGANATELALYCEVLDDLKRQKYLVNPQEHDPTRILSALLGDNLSGFERYAGTPRSVLFFTDNDYARNAAKTLAKEIGLPLDVLDDETMEELAAADLTSRTDAVRYTETITRFAKVFHPYMCVIGCMAAPNLSLLRNLNRILINAEKPLILGMIDGPFMSVLSTLATQTGCFECYEHRLLARLQDTLVYHRFVASTTQTRTIDGSRFAPMLHILTSAVVSEGYVYSTLGMMRLAGRILNIYMPLLEIQVEDLLRVPYCPACGSISRAEMSDMYTSTKRLVTEMLSKIELED